MAKQLSDHAAAAKMIRQHLKANGVAAKVRASSGSMTSSVNVTLTGDPLPATVEAVVKYADQFQYGHFNGMEDIYEHSNRRDDLPQVKHVFVRTEYSPQVRQAAWDYVKQYWNHGESDLPASCDDAHRCMVLGEWGSSRIHRTLNGVEGDFWRERKPRVRVNPTM